MTEVNASMTMAEILSALRKRYAAPEYAFLEQVRSRTGYQGAVRTADAMVMSLWPSRGLELHGIEIKVSRGDWLREKREPAKAEEILQFVDRWWLVVGDATIVEDGELPPTWGLLVPAGRGKLRAKVEAPKLEANPPTRDFLAGIMRNLEDAKSGMVPREEFAQALAEARENVRTEIMGSIAEGGELRALQHKFDTLRRAVDAFQKTSGVRIERWDAGDIGEAVRIVQKLGVDGAIKGAENMHRVLASHADGLGKRIAEAKSELRGRRARPPQALPPDQEPS